MTGPMKRIRNKTEFVMVNILEAGLIRPTDAARFMGISRQAFCQNHVKHLNEFRFEGVLLFSFLEVLERSLMNDLKVDKKQIAELKENRKILCVEKLDLIKSKLQ